MRFCVIAAILLFLISSVQAVFADGGDKCPAPLSAAQFSQLLTQYQKAADEHSPSTWQLSDHISKEVLCSVQTPRYVSELKAVEKGTLSSDPLPYLKLAQELQIRWENRYLLLVVANGRNQLDLANEGSSALLLGSVGLAIFKEPKEVSLFFTLFRHLFPVVFPSIATATAKIWDKTGSIDGYPVAPAHIMTMVSVNAENEKINPYDVWRTVISGTTRLAGAQLAIALINYFEVGAVTLGRFSFNPWVLLATVALSEGMEYTGEATVDETEYIKLKNKVIAAKENIKCDIANGDDNQTFEDSLLYYKAVLALSSYLDRPAMDAWNSYQKGLAQVKSAHKIPFYSEKSPEHALQVYDKKLTKIENSRDQTVVNEVSRFQVLNLLRGVANTSEIPALIAKLPHSAQTEAALIMNTAPLDVPNAYKYYIDALTDDQTEDLSKQFSDNSMPKDPDFILVESVSFLKSMNSPALADTIDNLTSAMNSKFLTSWAFAK